MTAKHYYLFGIRIWSVIIEMDEIEEEIEINENTLAAQTNVCETTQPAFGFTPWTPDYIDWRHAE